VSRARGRGRMARGASRAIARGGSSTPTRSARTPPVASSRRRRLERPSRPAPNHVCAMGAPRRPMKNSEDEFAGRACFRALAAGCPACAGLSGLEAGPMIAARAASRGSSRGPLPPVLREKYRDPLHPRCLPSMSYKDVAVRFDRHPFRPGLRARRFQRAPASQRLFRSPGSVRCLDVAAGPGDSVAPAADQRSGRMEASRSAPIDICEQDDPRSSTGRLPSVVRGSTRFDYLMTW
jgi:hypothetical protein